MNKTQNNKPVRVVFRKWNKSGDIIALFPEIPADNQGVLCQSYEHVGQHGGADYAHVIDDTKPASRYEYANLLQELKMIGYELKVVKRATRKDHEARREKIHIQLFSRE